MVTRRHGPRVELVPKADRPRMSAAASWWLDHPAAKGFTKRAEAEVPRMRESGFGKVAKDRWME